MYKKKPYGFFFKASQREPYSRWDRVCSRWNLGLFTLFAFLNIKQIIKKYFSNEKIF